MARSSSCERWSTVEVTDSEGGTEGVIDHYERSIDVGPDEEDAIFRRLEARLLLYRIFPPTIMRAEVCSANGLVDEGTTIVQHVMLRPMRLESAVRVVRVWHVLEDGVEETGFTYATLRGHPERGVSTFRIRRSPGRVTFAIDARSRPGSLLTRLTRPIARRFQRAATEAALVHFLRDAA